MKEGLTRRLESLRAELAEGERMLVELETRRSHVRDTLLRISGAIQVLEEMLGAEVMDPADVQNADD